jgi:hypothetical protein
MSTRRASSLEEANVLAGSPFCSEIRWLFQAGLLVFVVTVPIGAQRLSLHHLPAPAPPHHVRADTLGWITLGVFAARP